MRCPAEKERTKTWKSGLASTLAPPGSWEASFRFCARIGTRNRCSSQRRAPDRGSATSATRSLLGSWEAHGFPTAHRSHELPPHPPLGHPLPLRGGEGWGEAAVHGEPRPRPGILVCVDREKALRPCANP